MGGVRASDRLEAETPAVQPTDSRRWVGDAVFVPSVPLQVEWYQRACLDRKIMMAFVPGPIWANRVPARVEWASREWAPLHRTHVAAENPVR